MKYEKVILVTPESAEEQAQFESQYPNLQFFAFRALKTFVIPVEDEDLVRSKASGNGTSVNNYAAAVNVLNDYYGIQLPYALLTTTLCRSPAFREAIEAGRFESAPQREILVNALLRELGQPSWPANGTAARDLQNFKINLSVKLSQIGGKLKYQKA